MLKSFRHLTRVLFSESPSSESRQGNAQLACDLARWPSRPTLSLGAEPQTSQLGSWGWVLTGEGRPAGAASLLRLWGRRNLPLQCPWSWLSGEKGISSGDPALSHLEVVSSPGTTPGELYALTWV